MTARPDSLAAVAREVAAEWGVTLGPPFTLARYSYVASAGDDAVLRATPPEDASPTRRRTRSRSGGDGVGLRLWRPAAVRWILDHVPRWLDNELPRRVSAADEAGSS